MMRHSLLAIAMKLSKLQRDLLIEHVDGLHPFIDVPQENATRESLIIRELISYEPATHSILGTPLGTRLTLDGREALSFILGCYADGLTRWARLRDEKLFNADREIQLQQALRTSARESKRHELRQQNATPPEVSKPIRHAYDRPAVPAKS